MGMNLSLGSVPNFVIAPEGYEVALAEWSKGQNKSFVKVLLNDDGCLPGDTEQAISPGVLCIVRGTSPRGEHGHVVVGSVGEDRKTIKLLHDPHPEGSMLKSPLV